MATKHAVRYQEVADHKATGATYTPTILADFVADQIISKIKSETNRDSAIRVLDPAVGDGELLVSLVSRLIRRGHRNIEVVGYDTDAAALSAATNRLRMNFPAISLDLRHADFLDWVERQEDQESLFAANTRDAFDLLIANPPYVRTQIMGSDRAQRLANRFGLKGRVDLYHAFLIGLSKSLKPGGIAGVIVSNRFMTTKGAGALRAALRTNWRLAHVWDLGDTKLFEAAVLPAVIIANAGAPDFQDEIDFTSIYEASGEGTQTANDPIAALSLDGLVRLEDRRSFLVRRGILATASHPDQVWRIATAEGDDWLQTVKAKTWAHFGDIGKIRVGVKTTADKVFIKTDWSPVGSEPPELLRRLTTHHVSRRFKAQPSGKWRSILYPHHVVNGTRSAVDLERYPLSKAYLSGHRAQLESRNYVIEAGRKWFEIWVAQDPEAWDRPKLVFRDISERPTFWVDLDRTIVNGDCYWLVVEHALGDDLLWLAAGVANSTFAEAYYDHKFNNKLYAGRRRFITQYVEQFPLPDPHDNLSCDIIALAKRIYDEVDGSDTSALERELNSMVWRAFNLVEEGTR